MKKTLVLFLPLIVAIYISIGYTTHSIRTASSADLILDENLEALTDGEGGTVICGSRENKGPCWRQGTSLKFCGEYSYYACFATGDPKDNCTEPCN